LFFEALVLVRRHKGTNDPAIMSPMVGEERIRPGHSLGLVFCVPFSALTLMQGF